MKIVVSNEIESVCPQFVGAAVEAVVENSRYSAPLWEEIGELCSDYRARLTPSTAKV